jgi:hypothetical protein
VGTNTTQAASTAFVKANAGDKYKTTSSTAWTISKTTWAFTVEPGLSYTPTQDVTVSYDVANHAHGTVVSYSGTNLVIEFHNTTGSGTFSSWLINVGGFTEASGNLLAVNNLNDVASVSAALANLGGRPLTSIVPLVYGGTGATSAQAALNALSGGVGNGLFLGGDGTNVALKAIASSDLPASGVLAGSVGSSMEIPVLSVDAKGRVLSLGTAPVPTLALTTVAPAALATAASPGISVEAARADHVHAIPATTLAGEVVGSGVGSVTTALSTTGVSAGAYGGTGAIPVLTVDDKGRITAASTVAPTTTLSGDATGSGVGDVTVTLTTTGVSALTYGSSSAIPVLTVDAKGRITAASTAAALALATSAPSALATAAAIGISTRAARADHVHVIPTTTLTGDATGSGVGSFAVTLATTGVAALTYGSTAAIPVLTVDAKGRITAASTVAPLALTATAAAALGTSALAGISTQAARADHVHQIPFPAINSTASTAYTLNLNDNNDTVQFTAATAVTVTIPTNATAAFPIGSQILLLQYGAGQLTVGGAGVTIRSSGGKLKSGAQYAIMTLLKIGTDEWVLGGDIVA